LWSIALMSGLIFGNALPGQRLMRIDGSLDDLLIHRLGLLNDGWDDGLLVDDRLDLLDDLSSCDLGPDGGLLDDCGDGVLVVDGAPVGWLRYSRPHDVDLRKVLGGEGHLLKVDRHSLRIEEGLSHLMDLGLVLLDIDDRLNLLDLLLSNLLMNGDRLLDDLRGKGDSADALIEPLTLLAESLTLLTESLTLLAEPLTLLRLEILTLLRLQILIPSLRLLILKPLRLLILIEPLGLSILIKSLRLLILKP